VLLALPRDRVAKVLSWRNAVIWPQLGHSSTLGPGIVRTSSSKAWPH